MDQFNFQSAQRDHVHTPSCPRTFAVLASARTDGNTTDAMQRLMPPPNALVHLCQMNITPFDYHYANQGDDFLPLIRRMIEFDVWIFGTPVYWYNYSSFLKLFWDRMTDILYHHHNLKDRLAGKKAVLIASGSHPISPAFSVPFQETLKYLKMDFQGFWDQIYPLQDFQDHNKAQVEDAQKWWQKYFS